MEAPDGRRGVWTPREHSDTWAWRSGQGSCGEPHCQIGQLNGYIVSYCPAVKLSDVSVEARN